MPTPEELQARLKQRQALMDAFMPPTPTVDPVVEAQARADAQAGSGNVLQAGSNFAAALAGIDPSASQAAAMADKQEKSSMADLLMAKKEREAREAKQAAIRASFVDKEMAIPTGSSSRGKPLMGLSTEDGGTIFNDGAGGRMDDQGNPYTGKVTNLQAQKNINTKKISDSHLAFKTKKLAHKEEQDALREKWKKAMTPKQIQGTTDFNATLEVLKDIRRQKKGVNTGPFADIKSGFVDKWNPFGEGIDPDYASLRRSVNQSLAKYLKSMSGVAISEAEAKRLSTVLPSMDMDDKEFTRVLGDFEKALTRERATYLGDLKKGGKNTDAFEKYYGAKTVSSEPQSDGVDELSEEELDAQIQALEGN